MDLITAIFGIIGSLTAFFTFLLLRLELYRIWDGPSMEKFPSILHHAAFISSALWVMYGFIHGDIILVIIHNIGFLMAMSDLTLYLLYTESFTEMMKHHVIFFAELFSIALLGYLACSFDDPGRFAGLFCAYGNVLTCGVKIAYVTERTKRVPFFVCLGLFANGVIWSVYGIISSDWFIWVPNLVGAAVDLVQLVQHAIRYCRPAQRQIAEETEVLNQGGS